MGRGAGGGKGLLAVLKGRGPPEGTVHPRRDGRELGWMGRQEQPGEYPSHPGQGAGRHRESGRVSERPWYPGARVEGSAGQRETGGGAEKCGCKGGELTDPGKAHALGRPLSLALPFLRPCPRRAALRAQRTAEPLPVTVAILAGGLPATPCLSLPSPCSGAPQGLRSPGTTEAGRPRPKCQALW